MTIIVTGGGTGGHVYPALSVAAALRRRLPDLQLLYAGRTGGIEEGLARGASLDFLALPGKPVGSGAGAVRAYASLGLGVARAFRLLGRLKPAAVVGTGGYASTAIATAQYLRKGPLVLMDGNAIPGRTNRMLAKRAAAVCTSFEESDKWLPPGKARITGYPVRQQFADPIPQDAARARFGLESSMFTLLVIGGSQGATALNEAVGGCANHLTSKGVQILHQLGKRNEKLEAPWVSHWVQLNYIDDMPAAMSASDLVVSRAGVSSLSELAACGCASCLVPYPFAKDDHQRANAQELAAQGRAIMLLQQDLNPEALAALVGGLRDDEQRRRQLGKKLREWARLDAADQVAEITLEAAESRGK